MGEKGAHESVATMFGFTTADLNIVRLYEKSVKTSTDALATIDATAKSVVEFYRTLDAAAREAYISEGVKNWLHAERFGFDKANAYVTAISKLDVEMGGALGTALKKARAVAKKAGTDTPLGPTDTDEPHLIALALDREETARVDRDLQHAIEENAQSTFNLWNILQEREPEERERALTGWVDSLVRDKALNGHWVEKIAAIKKINSELGGILEKRVKRALDEQKRKAN